MRARALALALLPVMAAGCGGGGGGGDSRSQPPPLDPKVATSGPPADLRHADAKTAGTIRGWANAERNSRIDDAARFFSLPTIVLNGGDPTLLRTNQDVREWNKALPCGAALVRAVDVRGWTIARFQLVDRTGGHCDAPGATASTAFAMRRGKIALWIRVRDDVPPEKAAPARRPDARFLRTGRVPGAPPPPKAGEEGPGPSV